MSERILKSETVALWHAVRWMECCLQAWKKDSPEEADSDTYTVEQRRLVTAKRALRKINAIRKQEQRERVGDSHAN